jgi:serine O-acetyltransferase
MSSSPPGSSASPGAHSGSPFDTVVDALSAANEDLLQRRSRGPARPTLPAGRTVAAIVADLRAALFPWHSGGGVAAEEGLSEHVRRTLSRALTRLREQVRVALVFDCEHDGDRSPDCAACAREAATVTQGFASRLPTVRALLETDAWAAFDGDPAAKSPDEAVFCYPGMTAVIHHRLASQLHGLGVPLIPRMIAELAHAATGIDIHPGAQIGASFFVDHGTGVVIGETCRIGERVRLYQGVTLGARSFPLDEHGRPLKGVPRHPVVEDDVVIYAGATILGRITIGRGSSIGGNVWVTSSLPPRTHVSQAPFRQDLFDGGAGI